MLDYLKLQKRKKGKLKHNNVTRVKKENLKIFKTLPVNTLVFVRYWKNRDQDTLSKPSTRTESYWNRKGVYRITKVSFTKNITLKNYTPSNCHLIVHTLSGQKCTVKREDVYPIHLTDEERYFKDFKEYQNECLSKIIY